MSINIAAKNLPNNYWWALESKLPRLYIHVFIFSRLVVFSIWFFKHENIFLIRAITRYCNCKKILICSSSTYSKQNFCITGNVFYLSNNSWLFFTRIIFKFFLEITELGEREQGKGYYNTSLYLHIVYFLKKIMQIFILDNSFQKSRKL